MRILFVADVFGSAGRRAIDQLLPGLRKELEADVRARAYLGQAEIALLQSNKARALALARKAVSEEPELSAAHDLLRRLGAGP